MDNEPQVTNSCISYAAAVEVNNDYMKRKALEELSPCLHPSNRAAMNIGGGAFSRRTLREIPMHVYRANGSYERKHLSRARTLLKT